MIKIPRSIYDTIIEHARKEAPLECCGILSGKEGTVWKAFELKNSEQSPIRYSVLPQEQIKVFKEMEKESLDMLAIYHSHPHTPAFPSDTDVKLSFYPEVSSVIISLMEEIPIVKAFRIKKDRIETEEIEVI
ncbi:MAG: Mov34/MPN/PAD-1 family protein [Thermodesulfobacteriota bacterium]